ncbi:(2Fe-2S) ferredoxin domain-containing protein [Halanaerobium saccharolyticum]|jgi:NADH:ubiquinone oxidoreductase subunit E|uniref:NADH dehydrogenase subunit E n=2 Tax=Halanaerobium TaxID=2330 RepID=A0A1G6TAE7_9FIRM|nr:MULTISPECIES: (2Fe-2S) ferredoxin domain-containing protein [Halanaerobium]PTV93292.1 NADH dehydrogenase subunit E [Halanaerobium saccharolyticum]TDS35477.1 NADH dehydrogenase subunit E [Halanaerobium congolense]SDD25989.1 Thioredoxin-like [2Fe-2S] ferredoxin [Halanaerobium congolense]
MNEIIICVGSSCHLKGSEKIIEIFKEEIKKNQLKDVKISGSFCQGNCTEGVNIEINDQKIAAVTEENARKIFKRHLLADQNE